MHHIVFLFHLRPTSATIARILVNSITFAIYFVAIGLILKEFKVSLKTYLASASVIGLRFTTMIDIRGQRVFLPNRNIGIISRFHRGVVRAYVDIQMPEKVEEEVIIKEVKNIADSMYSQHKGIIIYEPDLFGVFPVENFAWKYLRIKFSIWPGQEQLIDGVFKQRVIGMMKHYSPDYTAGKYSIWAALWNQGLPSVHTEERCRSWKAGERNDPHDLRSTRILTRGP